MTCSHLSYEERMKSEEDTWLSDYVKLAIVKNYASGQICFLKM